MILVKEFRKSLGRFTTGIAEITCGDLNLLCSVVIFKDRSGVYIKMPQTNDTRDGKKYNVISWRSKEKSDFFQEEVKKQLAQKFPEALIIPDIKEIRKKSRNFAKEYKRSHSIPTPNLQKQKENFIFGKARSQSKFSRT